MEGQNLLTNSQEHYQQNLYHIDFMMQLDSSGSLLQLCRRIPSRDYEKYLM